MVIIRLPYLLLPFMRRYRNRKGTTSGLAVSVFDQDIPHNLGLVAPKTPEPMRSFTVLWNDGRREVMRGETIVEAFAERGLTIDDAQNMIWHPGTGDRFLWVNGKWKSYAGDTYAYRFAALLNPQPDTITENP